VISSPAVYARASWQAIFDSDVLASVRLGASGALGWQATAQVLAGGVPLAGTGSAMANWRRAGLDAKLSFLDRFFPLSLSGALFCAWQDAALVQGATSRASWLGGFVELAFSPDIHHHALVRFERIGVTSAGTPATSSDAGSAGDRTVLAAVVRRTLELTSRTELALHLEASYTTTSTGTDSPSTMGALAALDFAF
jgi:hypothetical protein